MSDADLTRLREALVRTLDRHTARLVVRRAGTVLGIPFDAEERGTIDFERCRHRIDEGERPVVVDGGAVYAQLPDGRSPIELPPEELLVDPDLGPV